MKDTNVGWIGKIPKHWDSVRGKYIFVNTKTIVGAKVDDYERLALTLNGVIKRSKDDNEGLQPTEFSGYQILKENELVFKLIDLQNISTSRVGLSKYTGIVSPAYVVLKTNKKVYPLFAEKYYLMMWMYEVFNALGDAGVRSNLNAKELLELRFPLPPYEEQKKIADYLDSKCLEIDELEKDIEHQIEILEEYKKSAITEAVTKGLNANVDMKDSEIDYINKYPTHWNIKRLKYVLKERNEKSIDGHEELLSVSQYKGVIPSQENSNRTMQANSLIGYKKVKKGDLVFNKLNPGLARFGASKYSGITSPDFAVYIPNSKICDAIFLQHLLKSSKYVSKIKSMGTGVGDGFARLYTPQLYEFCIAVPNSIEEVNEISEFIISIEKDIDSIIVDKKKQLDTLVEYKKSLIYEYVTGKKEVA